MPSSMSTAASFSHTTPPTAPSAGAAAADPSTETRLLDEEPRYDFGREALACAAQQGGLSVTVVLTGAYLQARFGARDPREQSLRAAFRAHEQEIRGALLGCLATAQADEYGFVVVS